MQVVKWTAKKKEYVKFKTRVANVYYCLGLQQC